MEVVKLDAFQHLFQGVRLSMKQNIMLATFRYTGSVASPFFASEKRTDGSPFKFRSALSNSDSTAR